ncbi:MAG: lipid-A-disaccharide synthase [Bacteroidota bacterium]
MRYYIISGEASGDLHGSNLMKEIKLLDSDAVFRCWGGDLMQQQLGNQKESSGVLVKHYRELAFMGFGEVLLNIRTILRNINFCKKDINEFQPHALILIDYPGFNLRIAKYVKKPGLSRFSGKIFYYISPQVWAWKQSRVSQIKRVVDKMFVILPFEKEFYKRFDYDVDFVGHPLLDAIEENKTGASASWRTAPVSTDKEIIAILPGSRKQEIKQMLPVMLNIRKHYNDHQFVIAGTTSVPDKYYKQFTAGTDVKIVYDQTYDLLRHSMAALVTSGTATLETALIGVPEVVCYKGSPFSYFIAKRLVKTKYISLVNIIMNKKIVTELIQEKFNAGNLKMELDKILPRQVHDSSDNGIRNKMIKNFIVLKQKLGEKGASKKAAELMLKYLK